MISYKEALRNERLNAVEVFLATPFIVVVTQYVPVLVTRLGASPLLLGILTSGAALMLTLASALGPSWLRRVPRWRPSMGIPLMIWRPDQPQRQDVYTPTSSVDLDVNTARKVLKLLEALDDHDDVQNVSSNFNVSEEAMAELARS